MDNKKTKQAPRSVLGRGLSALISTPPVAVIQGGKEPALQATFVSNAVLDLPASGAVSPESVSYAPVSELTPNPKQPRQDFAEAEIAELSDSIRTHGVLQPILVRPAATGSSARYEIIAGERRYRAAERAGLQQVPVIIKELGDRETLEIALVENVQRANLNPVEQALAYQRLMQEFSLDQQQIAEKVGKDRASVANFLRLLKLPQEVLALLRSGELSMGHAKAILSIREPAAQTRLAKKTIQEGLSVRELEGLVSRVVVLDSGKRARAKSPEQGSEGVFPGLLDRLRSALGTKVALKHSKTGSGKIEIEYFSEAELDRLVDHLCKSAQDIAI